MYGNSTGIAGLKLTTKFWMHSPEPLPDLL